MNFDKLHNSKDKAIRQFVIYAFIGLLSNLLGYMLYYLLTYLFYAPKSIMTILYIFGALVGFFANRRFTFKNDGSIGSFGFRYLLAQLSGYILNLSLLFIFVDIFNIKHQIVQAIAILVVAIFLFLLSKYFVFTSQALNSKNVKS